MTKICTEDLASGIFVLSRLVHKWKNYHFLFRVAFSTLSSKVLTDTFTGRWNTELCLKRVEGRRWRTLNGSFGSLLNISFPTAGKKSTVWYANSSPGVESRVKLEQMFRASRYKDVWFKNWGHDNFSKLLCIVQVSELQPEEEHWHFPQRTTVYK